MTGRGHALNVLELDLDDLYVTRIGAPVIVQVNAIGAAVVSTWKGLGINRAR